MRRIEKFLKYNIAILMLFVSLCSFGQSRQEKTNAIINKLNLVENQKTNYNFRLEPLKYQTTGNDSIKLIEIEKKITEEEIIKRISVAFDGMFTDKEISDTYDFMQTSAFNKFFISGGLYKALSTQFDDIDREVKEITTNLDKKIKKPTTKFEPIPIDKEDGFYATINYTSNTDKDIKLEDNPSLTSKDILEVKKVYSKYNNNRPEISLVLTKTGSQKFYLLTKENIGKPIAIVIAKQIVSLPIVNSEIVGGKVSISGDFSENEIDKMIEKLKEK